MRSPTAGSGYARCRSHYCSLDPDGPHRTSPSHLPRRQALSQDQSRKPHSASLVARGFGPPRLSYACRRPKLFRKAERPLSGGEARKRKSVPGWGRDGSYAPLSQPLVVTRLQRSPQAMASPSAQPLPLPFPLPPALPLPPRPRPSRTLPRSLRSFRHPARSSRCSSHRLTSRPSRLPRRSSPTRSS
jgi:hypothetical protein